MTYSERKDFCGKFNFITNLIFDVVTTYNETYVNKITNYKIDSVDANQCLEAIDIFLRLEHNGKNKEYKFTLKTIYWDDNNDESLEMTYENYQNLIGILSWELWNILNK